ncbi:MAG: hypothetical protein GX430_08390 [Treponema sp.]|nr:hypothetical protein [Treponema sp.]
MKKLLVLAILLPIALLGCVSAPPDKAPEPQRKERIETVRVPVLIKEDSYFADGILDRTVSYTYDSALKLLLEKRVQEPSRAEPTERSVYEYSGTVPTSVSLFDYEGKLRTRTEFKVDASGRVIQETVADSKGNPQSSVRYEYDASGLRTSRRVYNGAGALLAISEYSYTAGRLAVVILKDSAEGPAGRVEHEYDSAGRLVLRITFDPAGAVAQRERFVYDGDFLAEERLERGDGRVERRRVYEKGPEGAPAKSTLYDASGRIRDIRVFEYGFRTEERTVVYYE